MIDAIRDDLPDPAALTACEIPVSVQRAIPYLLHRAAAQSHRIATARLAPVGLEGKHIGILCVLCDVGAYPQGVIATTLGIDRTTMVALVDDLERRGWVERRRDLDDRRRAIVSVTDAGRRGRDQMLALVQGCEDDLLGPLDASERETLRGLLQRVVGAGPCPPVE